MEEPLENIIKEAEGLAQVIHGVLADLEAFTEKVRKSNLEQPTKFEEQLREILRD